MPENHNGRARGGAFGSKKGDRGSIEQPCAASLHSKPQDKIAAISRGHLTFNQEVQGSNPCALTKTINNLASGDWRSLGKHRGKHFWADADLKTLLHKTRADH